MSYHEEESRKFEQMEKEFALTVSYFDHLSESLRKMSRENEFHNAPEWTEMRAQYKVDIADGQRVILSYHGVTNTGQFTYVINDIKGVVERMRVLVEKMENFIAKKAAGTEHNLGQNASSVGGI